MLLISSAIDIILFPHFMVLLVSRITERVVNEFSHIFLESGSWLDFGMNVSQLGSFYHFQSCWRT